MLRDFWNDGVDELQMVNESESQWKMFVDQTIETNGKLSELGRMDIQTIEFTEEMVEVLVHLFYETTDLSMSRHLLLILSWVWKTREQLFQNMSQETRDQLWQGLNRMLDASDGWIKFLASRLLTVYVSQIKPEDMLMESKMEKYIQTIERMVVLEKDRQLAWLECRLLSFVLQYHPKFRTVLDQISPTILYSMKEALIQEHKHPQVQYEILLIFWFVSFDFQNIDTLNRIKILPVLFEMLRTTSKEKIIRVSLAILRNMVEDPPTVSAMIGHRALDLVQALLLRSYSDLEILADMTYIQSKLTNMYQSLTSFEEYASEIRSGNLYWSPSHRSELFWKQNVRKLNSNEHEILRLLIEIAGDQTISPTTLAIAVHDLGQYVRFYPEGKRDLEKMNGKTVMMDLVEFPDPEVRLEALVALQKYMVGRW